MWPGRARAWFASASVAGRLSKKASSFGSAKLNALVRSPLTARRQAEMFGSITPKRASMKRITEVWSNTCELTQPPRLQGEMMVIGTRGPMPYGRCSKPFSIALSW